MSHVLLALALGAVAVLGGASWLLYQTRGFARRKEYRLRRGWRPERDERTGIR